MNFACRRDCIKNNKSCTLLDRVVISRHSLAYPDMQEESLA